MTRLLDEDVFGLEVSVDDALLMQVLESADNLRQVEADDGGGEDVIVLAVAEDVEVAAGAEGDAPADELIVFRGADEVGQERGAAAEAAEDGDFVAGAAVGVMVGGGLLHHLESEVVVAGVVVDEEYGAGGAFA